MIGEQYWHVVQDGLRGSWEPGSILAFWERNGIVNVFFDVSTSDGPGSTADIWISGESLPEIVFLKIFKVLGSTALAFAVPEMKDPNDFPNEECIGRVEANERLCSRRPST